MNLLVSDFFERLLAAEGPTPLAWINEPVQKGQAFLAGHPLASDVGEGFEQVYRELKGREASPDLVETGRLLMLWSQHHLNMETMELTRHLEVLVDLALREQDRLVAARPTLECLWSLGSSEDFEEALGELERELVALEEEAVARGLSVHAHFESLGSRLSRLFALAAEPETDEQLFLEVRRLREEWASLKRTLAAASVHVLGQEKTVSYQHVEEFRQTVAAYQEGSLSEADFQSHVTGHRQRLADTVDLLRSSWTDSPQRTHGLDQMERSLAALSLPRSPGDPQLELLSHDYCQALLELTQESAC